MISNLTSRRGFLKTAAFAAGSTALAQTDGRPNVLFLMSDQLRFDCLGANGNRIVRTPNLDRLAQSSSNFRRAYVQSPVCVPSRISYLSGRYPHTHRNRVNYTPGNPQERFMQSYLKDVGYQTGSVGKLHFYPPTNDQARATGFDRVQLHDGVGLTDPYSDYVTWRKKNDPHASTAENALDPKLGGNPFRAAVPYEYSPTHWVGEQTRSMLRDFAQSPKPFFLYSSFFKPHSPFQLPDPYDEMYSGVEIPLPPRVSLEDVQKLPLPLQRLILRGKKPEYTTPPEQLQWIYRSYYGAVSMVDYEIGRILDTLEKTGRASETIIVFGVDHGAQLLEHGLMDKNVFFESSVHGPFLFRTPGQKAGEIRDEFVEMIDVLPTLLDFCKAPIPDSIQGRSFAPLLTGRANEYKKRNMVFSENIIPEVITSGNLDMPFTPGKGVAGIEHPDAKMVRTARWKFNYYPGHGAELYDMQNDPGELRNLVKDPSHRETVSDLKEALLDWMIAADENEQIARRWLL